MAKDGNGKPTGKSSPMMTKNQMMKECKMGNKKACDMMNKQSKSKNGDKK